MSASPSSRAQRPGSQRLAAIFLTAGAVLALAAALGGVWLARAGIVLALAAGVAAVVVLSVRMRADRHEHGRALVAAARQQHSALAAERIHHRGVVESLHHANSEQRQKLSELSECIAQQKVLISQGRRDLGAAAAEGRTLRDDLGQRQDEVARLRHDLASREAELQALLGATADVVPLPRYGKSKNLNWDSLPSADELWAEGRHPAVQSLTDVLAAVGQPTEAVRRRA